MARIDNLAGKEHKLTAEDRLKGGKKSAEVRRERKAFRDMTEDFLSMVVKGETVAEIKAEAESLGYDTNEWNAAQYAVMAQGLKMLRGDLPAFTMLLDLVGEKPADKQQVAVEELPTINLVKSKKRK